MTNQPHTELCQCQYCHGLGVISLRGYGTHTCFECGGTGKTLWIRKSKPRKTEYCKHYLDCDRAEDCFNGVFCPFFENQFNNLGEEMLDCEEIAKNNFDKIWEGEG